jgi:hypothetical protein
MGTRALTFVYGESGDEVLCMYSQWDGYLSGHGKALAAFINGITLINGITGKETVPVANGMGCLAAQLVVHFKTEVGNFYLVNGKQDHGQDFEYHISDNFVHVKAYDKTIFNGSWQEFSDFCIAED